MFQWNQLISATPRDSRTSKGTGSILSGRSSEVAVGDHAVDASPLQRDEEILSAIKQTPTCLLKPSQFLVGTSGVLYLTFAGFPDPIMSLKEQWEGIKNVNIAIENANSKWPMAALGALTSEDRVFKLDQLEALTSLSKKISIRLKKISQKIILSSLSYVIFSSRSLEKIVFRADIPPHEFEEPVDYVPMIEQTLKNADEIKEYIKEVNKPGNRSQLSYI
ncbi:UNVERIFIED_CONTAM: hypothetical protein HDU68_000728 [Siphonaria sp. JEL0065]|nr:hypothetical protein HDU68_000728 [Siphonaria sp. JEL0065]